MDEKTVKESLSGLIISRDIPVGDNIKYIRDWISSWSDKVPHHGIGNLGEAAVFSSIIEIPTYVISLDTQYERRSLYKGVYPYFGKNIFPNFINLSNHSDLWSVNVSLIEDFKTKINCYMVQGSENITICNDCQGRGEVYCSSCGGHGELTCSTCGGRARIACSRCNGVGTENCHRCGGRGSFQGNSDVNYREITCPSCNGRQRVTCSSCGGNGTKDCPDCTNGKVRCSRCSGSGILTCGSCKGAGKFISLEYLKDAFVYRGWLRSVHYDSIPSEIVSKISGERNSSETIVEYEDRLISDAIFESTNHTKLKHMGKDFFQAVRNIKAMGVYSKDYRILKQKIVIKKVDVLKVDYKYLEKQYTMWLYGKTSVWASISPITEYRDNLFNEASKEFSIKAYSNALSLIEKAIEMSPKKEYGEFKAKITKKIHQQYVLNAFLGGTIFPVIGNISGILIGLILRYIYSTDIKSDKQRVKYSFWSSFIINLTLAVILFLLLYYDV